MNEKNLKVWAFHIENLLKEVYHLVRVANLRTRYAVSLNVLKHGGVIVCAWKDTESFIDPVVFRQDIADTIPQPHWDAVKFETVMAQIRKVRNFLEDCIENRVRIHPADQGPGAA